MISHLPVELTLMHFLLAYIGLFIHLLGKLKSATKKPKFSKKVFIKDNWVNTLASVLLIPIILILLCEPAIKTTLPINNLTAVLAGYQVNSVFRFLMNFYPVNNNKNKIEQDGL
jgi:hypothetical protein